MSLNEATCRHCGNSFTRQPKSTAAYCSTRCRSAAKDAAEAAKRAERMAPLHAILNAAPPEVTDISVVTYHAHAVVWKVRRGSPAAHSSDSDAETFAVLNFYQMPDYVREALVEQAPDLIPAEVLALDPDPMRAIKLHQVAISSPQHWLGLYDKDT